MENLDGQIICTKVREGEQRFVRLKEGDPKGRHVVIVDDFVQSGGTLIECQKVLAAHGAAQVSAYVTHGIFPNQTWQRFQHDGGVGPDKGMNGSLYSTPKHLEKIHHL
ncbi:hypothetical protein HPP92_008329 [Vanilla planifolia]|uniref:Phosphoribosyltransferase domain-containing protein n=1 Tax=Vanilla planifolia TaxID=51239 RepID=A0A835R2G6_VANPL|nr:hypothetical protein HPP92_008329 [Vanilla planifolia]